MEIKIFSGERVKDLDSGFTGVVTGTDEQGGTLNRVLITSDAAVPEGMKAPTLWVAADRVEKIEPAPRAAPPAPPADAVDESAAVSGAKTPAAKKG